MLQLEHRLFDQRASKVHIVPIRLDSHYSCNGIYPFHITYFRKGGDKTRRLHNPAKRIKEES